MRDLRKDWNVLYGIIDWIAIPKQQIVKEWLERAIKAETEVERLIKINQGCEQEAHIQDEILRRYKAENAKLRAVVEAAREFFEGTGCEPKECKKCDPKYINFCERSRIGQALAELDKEGE